MWPPAGGLGMAAVKMLCPTDMEDMDSSECFRPPTCRPAEHRGRRPSTRRTESSTWSDTPAAPTPLYTAPAAPVTHALPLSVRAMLYVQYGGTVGPLWSDIWAYKIADGTWAWWNGAQ